MSESQEIINVKAIYMAAYENFINAETPLMKTVYAQAHERATKKMLVYGFTQNEINALRRHVMKHRCE
jgi:hypothetical protein